MDGSTRKPLSDGTHSRIGFRVAQGAVRQDRGAVVIVSAARRVARAGLPTRYGTFELFVYETPRHEAPGALERPESKECIGCVTAS